MIGNNLTSLKEEEDQKSRQGKESQMRIPQISDYFPHLPNSIQNYGQAFLKGQDHPEAHNFMPFPYEELQERAPGLDNHQMFQNYFQQHGNYFKTNWLINPFDNYYDSKIKRQEYDEQKYWHSQIKDQESASPNHQQNLQPYEIPKHQENHYTMRCVYEDPNQFFGNCINPYREQKSIKRKLKVQAYLKKRKMRSFEKKVIYKCRKEVADNRIRYRGRFISISQAAQFLGLSSTDQYCAAELSQKLKQNKQSNNTVIQQKEPEVEAKIEDVPDDQI